MSGETEADVSAWTIDSLRYHLEQIAADLDRRYQQRFDAQEHAVAAAFDAQEQVVTLLTKLLDERYATQTKAVDAAFLAAESAVNTALMTAEKAVTKAETAADKRFESVNEFRGQLADQAATLLSRSEADVRIGSLSDKIDTLQGRVDKSEGRSTGISLSAGAMVGALSAAVAIVTIVVIVVNLATGRMG